MTTLEALEKQLQVRSDNAYVAYINYLRRDECLGWEIKVERGVFGPNELQAHKNAYEALGRHRALQESATLVKNMILEQSQSGVQGSAT